MFGSLGNIQEEWNRSLDVCIYINKIIGNEEISGP